MLNLYEDCVQVTAGPQTPQGLGKFTKVVNFSFTKVTMLKLYYILIWQIFPRLLKGVGEGGCWMM